MKKLILLWLALSAAPAFAQYSVWSEPIINQQGQPIPGATVAVCSSLPSLVIPCGGSSLATIFASFSGGSQINPLYTDQFGRAPIYAASGNYYLQVYGNGIQTSIVPITIGGSGGSGSNILPTPNVFTNTNFFVNTGSFSNGQMNEYLTSNLNGISFLTEYQVGRPGAYATDAEADGVAVPSTSTIGQINAGADYINTSAVSSPLGDNNLAVGRYSQCRVLASNGACWGSNALAEDAGGTSGHWMIGTEIDNVVNGSPHNVWGLLMNGLLNGTMPPAFAPGNTTNSNYAAAFVLNTAGAHPWPTGIIVTPGTVNGTGLLLDRNYGSGAQPSSMFCMNGYDGSNNHTGCLNVDPLGNIILTPAPGQAVNVGNLTVTGTCTGCGGGGGSPVTGANAGQVTSATSATTIGPVAGGAIEVQNVCSGASCSLGVGDLCDKINTALKACPTGQVNSCHLRVTQTVPGTIDVCSSTTSDFFQGVGGIMVDIELKALIQLKAGVNVPISPIYVHGTGSNQNVRGTGFVMDPSFPTNMTVPGGATEGPLGPGSYRRMIIDGGRSSTTVTDNWAVNTSDGIWENLSFDCNYVANCIPYYTANRQEKSGLYKDVFWGLAPNSGTSTSIAAFFDHKAASTGNSGPSHFTVENTDINGFTGSIGTTTNNTIYGVAYEAQNCTGTTIFGQTCQSGPSGGNIHIIGGTYRGLQVTPTSQLMQDAVWIDGSTNDDINGIHCEWMALFCVELGVGGHSTSNTDVRNISDVNNAVAALHFATTTSGNTAKQIDNGIQDDNNSCVIGVNVRSYTQANGGQGDWGTSPICGNSGINTTAGSTLTGVPEVFGSIAGSGSTPTLPILLPPGITGRAGITSDTLATTDCNPTPITWTGSSAVTLAVPTPTTLGLTNCYTRLLNLSTSTVTITPTTYQCSLNEGTPASTCVLPAGETATLGIDPIHSSTWAVITSLTAGGGGTSVSVNGSSVSSPNFNGTTPAAPTNGLNVTWQNSGSSVSAYLAGDGNAAHCLLGTGTFATCPSGTPAWGNGFGAQTASTTGSGVSLANYYTVWTATGTPASHPQWALTGSTNANGAFAINNTSGYSFGAYDSNSTGYNSGLTYGQFMSDVTAGTQPYFTGSNNGTIFFSIAANNASPTQIVQSLGLAGTAYGASKYFNETSGSITIAPPITGALSTSINSLQATTDTFVYRATTDTLTNKTISGSSNTLSNISLSSLTGLGTGVATALGDNVGSAGAFVVNGGALGTPSGGTLTNATGLPLSGVVAGSAPSGTFDFSGSTVLKTPVAAGFTAGANGSVGFDSTNKMEHNYTNSVDSLLMTIPASASITANDCVEFTKSSGVIGLADTGSSCGAGGGGANQSLNNLASVAINASLVPGSANAINVGSATDYYTEVFTNILGLEGTTSGTATFTAPAVAGTTSNPVVATNALQLPNGTAALPSLVFPNSTNNGIYSNSSTKTCVSTGGNNVLCVGSGANGIVVPENGGYNFSTTSNDASAASGVNIGAVGTSTTEAIETNGLVLQANQCKITSAITLTTGTSICSFTLPNSAQTWGYTCTGTYQTSASSITLTLGTQFAHAATVSNHNAQIWSAANTSTFAGPITNTGTSATTTLTGVAPTSGTSVPWSASGTFTGNATSGTFLIYGTASTTSDAQINAGSTCTIY